MNLESERRETNGWGLFQSGSRGLGHIYVHLAPPLFRSAAYRLWKPIIARQSTGSRGWECVRRVIQTTRSTNAERVECGFPLVQARQAGEPHWRPQARCFLLCHALHR
jgi:hypothetical protein